MMDNKTMNDILLNRMDRFDKVLSLIPDEVFKGIVKSSFNSMDIMNLLGDEIIKRGFGTKEEYLHTFRIK